MRLELGNEHKVKIYHRKHSRKLYNSQGQMVRSLLRLGHSEDSLHVDSVSNKISRKGIGVLPRFVHSKLLFLASVAS
jgi:hypothetical protein